MHIFILNTKLLAKHSYFIKMFILKLYTNYFLEHFIKQNSIPKINIRPLGLPRLNTFLEYKGCSITPIFPYLQDGFY